MRHKNPIVSRVDTDLEWARDDETNRLSYISQARSKMHEIDDYIASLESLTTNLLKQIEHHKYARKYKL